MPDFLDTVFFNNTLTQWLIAAAFILGSLVAGNLFSLIVRKILIFIFRKNKDDANHPVIKSLKNPLVFLVFIVGLEISLHNLNLNETFRLWADRILDSLLVIIITWALTKAVNALILHFVPRDEKLHPGKNEARLQPLLQKFSTFVIWLIAGIIILRTMGYNVSALMAGLGLGGAALALASKDTL